VNTWDVIIAGAGIAGLSTALALRERGASVLVLERGEPGCEASTAAAGMLAATDPETPPPLRELAMIAARMYPEFVAKLQRASGIKTDLRRQGTIVLGEESPPPNYRQLSAGELHDLEPALDAKEYPASFVEEDCVDPVLLMRAVIRAAQLNSIQIRTGVTVQQIHWTGSHVLTETTAGQFKSRAAVNCLGAWSGPPVKPRKGQMMYLQPQRTGLLQHVVRAPGAYMVPRSSGRVLVGTTVEDVGFDKTVEQQTICMMHDSAALYVPELASATIVETWAGLRPGTPDALPLIGPTQEQNVIIASGLFRNGILLAPVVGEMVAGLVLGNPVSLNLSPFAPSRFTLAKAGS
jgi:glycine oxidase